MSKQTLNQSPKASQKLAKWAESLGLSATIIARSRGQCRVVHPGTRGSTSSPQKVIEIEGIRFSVGGARCYLEARQRQADKSATQEV